MGSLKAEDLNDEQLKCRELEGAALRDTPEEIAKVCARLGHVEYSAKALGLACRCRGVECVRALVEGGASFHTKLSNYMVQTYGSYGEDLSVLLLDAKPQRYIPYLNIAMLFDDPIPTGMGEKYMLPLDKRLEVLDYLIENKEKAGFAPGELLYYAIMLKDERMTLELENRGAEFSEYRKGVFGGKGERKDFYMWTGLLETLSEKEFKPVVSRIAKRLGGEKLHCTDGIYHACSEALLDEENLRYYFEIFDTPKVIKSELMKAAVNGGKIGCLEFAAENGWLKQPKTRDELIAYSEEKGKTECTAFLLDFKNRTANFAAEREKAEKQAMRELNAAPDSATALKRLWSWKKLESGGLMITSYKGDKTEVTVPEKIGKDTVTALGMAFSPAARAISKEISDLRQTITLVTLPETITEICDDAFRACSGLLYVSIPDSVTKIGKSAFLGCRDLQEITIPDGVAEISAETFRNCRALGSAVIPESVKTIGEKAFSDCRELEKITLPSGLSKIGEAAFADCKLKEIELPRALEEIPAHCFERCRELKRVVIPRGVKMISEKAFWGCSVLSSAELPDTLEKIGVYAFGYCDALETLTVPEGVTEIGGRAFGDCKKLRRVELPRSLAKAVNLTPYERNGHMITLFEGSPNVTAAVCPKSYAERYCRRNNIPYVNIEE